MVPKANLKQTTLNWTPARKRAVTPQQQPDQPSRVESPSAAAAGTSTNSTPQSAPPPPRLKSILKQTKLQWPQGGYLFDVPRDYSEEHLYSRNKTLQREGGGRDAEDMQKIQKLNGGHISIDPQATGEIDGGGEGDEKRNLGEEAEKNRLEASRSSSFLGVKDFSLLDDDDIGNGKGGDEDCVVPQAAVQGETRI